jgi:hypothetical protein
VTPTVILRLVLCMALLATSPVAAEETVLDAFDDLSGWTAAVSDEGAVRMNLEETREGTVLRVDFDIPTEGGFAIVRRPIDLELPENYAFTFALRGEAERQNFEFKIVDPSGKSVWWRRLRDFAFPTVWQRTVVRKARILPAWGERDPPSRIGAIEIAISAGNGGSGTFWIDDLRFEAREPASAYRRSATITASSTLPGRAPEHALDDDPASGWTSEPAPPAQSLTIDLVRQRELGGLFVDWDPLDFATAYRVQLSDDGSTWKTAFAVESGRGGRDAVYLPDTETRYLRFLLDESSRGQGYGILSIEVQPLEFSDTPNQFFDALAAHAPRGTYPKAFSREQTYWTVVGVEGDEKNALLNEEGMLEVEKGGFSIEPFLHVDGELVTWSDVTTRQTLDEGYLPIPTVTWDAGPLALHVTAFAAGAGDDSTLYALYAVENRDAAPRPARLFLALRPFQVNPPWQSLNMVGGVAPIYEIRFDAGMTWVNRDKPVVPLVPPARFGATSQARSAVVDVLREGRVPARRSARDPAGFASGAFEWELELAPGERKEIAIAVPFHPEDTFVPPTERSATEARDRLEETRARWKRRLNHVELDLPLEGAPLARSVRSTLAYVLLNRAGPRIQPGPRNYARSWIRDGSLTATALLQHGFTSEPREYLEWYAPFQGEDGRIPCCVDRAGADPVPEHDSHGQFLYAIGELYRYTADVGFVSELWPRVVATVDHLDRLRRSRRTETYRTEERRGFFGLLPQSISHEGYASKPVHSYWDDFFALRGFADAAMLAVAIGDEPNAARFTAIHDEFRADLAASIAWTIERHGLDTIPASVELGDFDPSATAIAFEPGGARDLLPEAPLRRTFERYVEILRARRTDPASWDAYTPYEIRNAAALVRLGMRDEAREVLRDMIDAQRPHGWNLWQEILWRDARRPSFIGDMPHTWVASALVRAVRTLLVYERFSDRSLVLGAGIPREWVTEGRRVSARRLPTHHGTLHLSIESETAERLRMRVSGDVRIPPGGIVLRPPLAGPLRSATVNGRPVDELDRERATIRELPADVLFESEPAAAAGGPHG